MAPVSPYPLGIIHKMGLPIRKFKYCHFLKTWNDPEGIRVKCNKSDWGKTNIQTSSYKNTCLGDEHSIVTTVNKTICIHTENCQRTDLSSNHKKFCTYIWWKMLTRLIVATISQYVQYQVIILYIWNYCNVCQ